MKTRFLILFFALLVALPTACAEEKAIDKSRFHPPQTEAEKALDHILMLDSNDKYFPSFVFKALERDKSKDKNYSDLFTKELEDAWEKAYLSTPPEDDEGGRYAGASFITCGNGDMPDHFLFYTSKSNDHEAFIDMAFPEFAQARVRLPPPFKMIKKNGRWLLDSVDCGRMIKFNVK